MRLFMIGHSLGGYGDVFFAPAPKVPGTKIISNPDPAPLCEIYIYKRGSDGRLPDCQIDWLFCLFCWAVSFSISNWRFQASNCWRTFGLLRLSVPVASHAGRHSLFGPFACRASATMPLSGSAANPTFFDMMVVFFYRCVPRERGQAVCEVCAHNGARVAKTQC